jgi:hypothetical protein
MNGSFASPISVLRRFALFLIGVFFLLDGAAAQAGDEGFVPRQGLWWNPLRPGFGMDVHVDNESLAAVLYTYDDDGLPIWYLSVAPRSGKSWSGRLLEYSFDSATGDYSAVVIGTIGLEFSDDQHVVMNWAIRGNEGSEAMEAFILSKDLPVADASGFYYDFNETGWGYTFTSQGLFHAVVTYIYDSEGKPRWLLGLLESDPSDPGYQQAGGFEVPLKYHVDGFGMDEPPTSLRSSAAGSVGFTVDQSRGSASTPDGQRHSDIRAAIVIAALTAQADIEFEDPEDPLDRLARWVRSIEGPILASKPRAAPRATLQIAGSTFLPFSTNAPYEAQLVLAGDAGLTSNGTYSWRLYNTTSGVNASLVSSGGDSATVGTGTGAGGLTLQVEYTDTQNGLHLFADKHITITRGSELPLGIHLNGDTRLLRSHVGAYFADVYGGMPPYGPVKWKFSDGGSDQTQGDSRVLYQFKREGQISDRQRVIATVTDATGASAGASLPVELIPEPLSLRLQGKDITYTGIEHTYTLLDNVTENLPDYITATEWNTDGQPVDGCGKRIERCTVRWDEAGQHFVSVFVSDGEYTATATKIVDVQPNCETDPNGECFVLTAKLLKPPTKLRVDEPGAWLVEVNGGAPPYDVVFDWGDGSSKLSVTLREAGIAARSHAFGNVDTYTVRIDVVDALGTLIVPGFESDVAVAPDQSCETDVNGECFVLVAKLLTPPTRLEVEEVGSWRVEVNGGTPPYTVVFDWGDGSGSSSATLQQAGVATRSHAYAKADAYTVKIDVNDALGTKLVPAIATGVTVAEAQQPVTNFADYRTGSSCAGSSEPKWTIDLQQSGANVTGQIRFHKCPDGGRAQYGVTGTADGGSTVRLDGTRTGGVGPLGSSAPGTTTFTVGLSGPPSPDFSQ